MSADPTVPSDSPPTPVAAALADFLRALTQRNASTHTIKAYRTDLAEFVTFVGPEELKAIDHLLIRAFLGQLYERGLGKASVARALSSTRSFFKWMGREHMIESNQIGRAHV
jgi:integrase/recombinase XerC